MGVDARIDDAEKRQLGYLRVTWWYEGTYSTMTYDMTIRTHELAWPGRHGIEY